MRGPESGFTLIELLVALVLLATTGFGILNWVNTCIMSLEKAKGHQERIVALRSAASFMETVNPTLTPEGQKNLGLLRVTWNSKPVSGPTGSTNLNNFYLTLYQTKVKVSMAGRYIDEFDLATLGVRRQGGELDEEAEELQRLKESSTAATELGQ
jgi:general secretion pathway protein I